MLKSCMKGNKASANLLSSPEILQMIQQYSVTCNFFREILQDVQQWGFIMQATSEKTRRIGKR